jgi:ribosomal protein S18 acetylase RimI-like enzyme
VFALAPPPRRRTRLGTRGLCDDRSLTAEGVEIRRAEDGDRRPLALLFAAVAEEGDGIAAEPPVDVARRAASWDLERTLVADAAGEVVGLLFVVESGLGFGELGMLVARGWRGRGVGTALVAAAIEWARARGLHKLTLGVFPRNEAAVALYRKFGFVDEGMRSKHIRRANGELWDLLEMGLLL